MKRTIFLVLFLSFVGVALACVLLPRESELASMHMRDKNFQQALQEFESRKMQGDFSAATVGGLAQLYVQNGNIDQAILLLEDFVATHPNNLQAFELLGTYYQFAERSADYLRNLVRVVQLTEITQYTTAQERQVHIAYVRSLAQLYNFHGEHEKQRDTLERLVAEGGATIDDRIALVQVESVLGEKAQALAHMFHVYKILGVRMDEYARELMISLLMDQGRQSDVLYFVREWVDRGKKGFDAEQLVALIGMLQRWGSDALIYEVLSHYHDRLVQDPSVQRSLLSAYVDSALQLETVSRLYPVFKGWYEAKILPSSFYNQALLLALVAKDEAMAFSILNTMSSANVGDDALAKLLLAWLQMPPESSIYRDIAGQLQAIFVSEETVATSPPIVRDFRTVLLAFLRAFDHPAAIEHMISADYSALSLEQRIALLPLFQSARFHAPLASLLRSFEAASVSVTPYLVPIVQAYLFMGDVTGGKRFLSQNASDFQAQDAEGYSYAVVLLSAAVGEDDKVQAWLDQVGARASESELQTLYRTAATWKCYGIAKTVARYASDRFATTSNQLLYAEALLRDGEIQEVSTFLYDVESPMKQDEVFYFSILSELLLKHDIQDPYRTRYRTDLISYWVTALKNYSGDLTHSSILDSVYGLLSLQAYSELRPFLQDVALRDPKRFGAMYVETLLGVGALEEAASYVTAMLVNIQKDAELSEALRWSFIDMAATHATLATLSARAEKGEVLWYLAYEKALQRDEANTELLHAFWRRMARRDGLSPEISKNLAYHLLDLREYELASRLLFMNAQGMPADSFAVQDLVYFWQEHPAFTNVKWLSIRASQASSDHFPHWLSYLNLVNAQTEVVRLAEIRGVPSGRLVEPYVEALVETNAREKAGEILSRVIVSDSDVRRLRVYAELAARIERLQLSLSAYRRVVTILPSDTKALQDAANVAYQMGQYEEAQKYYETYFEVCAAKSIPVTLTSHMQMGRIYQALFERGRKRNPTLAQKAAKHFSAVRSDPAAARTLNDSDRVKMEEEIPAGSVEFESVMEGEDGAFVVERDGNKVSYKRFTGAVAKGNLQDAIDYVWAAYYLGDRAKAREEMRRLHQAYPESYEVAFAQVELLVQEHAYEEALVGLAEIGERLSKAMTARASKQSEEALRYRVQVLEGSVYFQMGYVEKALESWQRAKAPYLGKPGYSEVFAAQKELPADLSLLNAQAAMQAGKKRSALSYLQAARAVSPDSNWVAEEWQKFQRERRVLWHQEVDHYYVKKGERSTTLSSLVGKNISDVTRVTAKFDVRHSAVKSIYREDRTLGNVDAVRERLEMAVHTANSNDHEMQLSVFGAPDSGPGVGVTYRIPDYAYSAHVVAEYHRPYWDLVQGSILGAAVDTVGAGYSRSLGRVSGMLESGYHHYSIEQDQAIADSFYGKFSLEYHFPSLPERMETSVFYYLDAEYFDGEPRTLLSLDGTARYEPLPLSSREAHVGGVRMGYRLPLDVAADGYAGFSRDRLGGSGPITGASLSYDFSDDVRFGVRGDYAHVSLAGGGEGLRSVVFGEVRF